MQVKLRTQTFASGFEFVVFLRERAAADIGWKRLPARILHFSEQLIDKFLIHWRCRSETEAPANLRARKISASHRRMRFGIIAHQSWF